MSFLKTATKGLGMVVDVVSSYGYRGQGANDGGMWYFGNNGLDLHFRYGGLNSCIDAYTKCPPVTAVINKMAQAYINGKTFIQNTQGKEANSLEAKKLKALFKRPNPLQSWKQFEAQAYIYHKLFGFTIILPIKPVGFPNIDATALWNIPPFMVNVKETKELFYQNPKGIVSQIVLTYKGEKSTLNVADLLIIEDITPSFTSLIIPDSRIKSLEMPINNIIGALESRNVLINYRGALGMLSPEKDPMGTIPLNDTDKEALQNDFRRYGLKRQQWQIIISNAAMKWQQMGYPTKDLMLFEEIEDSTKMICDGLNFPFRLLNYSGGALSGSDVKQFNKQLYTDAIIPESESIYEQLSQFLKLEDYNLRIVKDYTHMAVLQEDINLMAAARLNLSKSAQMDFLCNVITLNQYRELLKIPTTGPDGDVYYSDIKNLIGTPKVAAGEMKENPDDQNSGGGNA